MKIEIDEMTEEWRKNLTIECDICGKKIVGIENMIDAGDKVVCSEECLQKAIGEFRHFENVLNKHPSSMEEYEEIKHYKKYGM